MTSLPSWSSERTGELMNPKPLSLPGQIEDAIKSAALLGDNAFDAIEGRGLHRLRLMLQQEVQFLEARVKYLQEVANVIDNAHDAETVKTLRRRLKRIQPVPAKSEASADEGA